MSSGEMDVGEPMSSGEMNVGEPSRTVQFLKWNLLGFKHHKTSLAFNLSRPGLYTSSLAPVYQSVLQNVIVIVIKDQAFISK